MDARLHLREAVGMSRLDQIRREAALEAAQAPDVDASEDPGFDAELAAALASMAPSAPYVEALVWLAAAAVSDPSQIAVAVRAARTAPPLDLRARRGDRGVTEAAAAKILDVSAASLGRLESRIGLGWLNLAPSRVHAYLDRLGVSDAAFARSVAAAAPVGPAYAYGYRPRTDAEQPVAVEQPADDLERLIAWSHELLSSGG